MKIHVKVKTLFFSFLFAVLFACTDLKMTETANVVEDAEQEAATLTLVVDDSSFFLAAATDIDDIVGGFVDCMSGNEETFDVVDEDGDGDYDFYVGQGDDDCYLFLESFTINSTSFQTDAADNESSTAWADNSTVIADGEDDASSAEVLVVDNIDEDGPYGFNGDIEGEFHIRTEIEGVAVSAILREAATLDLEGHSVPSFEMTLPDDGTGTDDFSLQKVYLDGGSGEYRFVINFTLDCPENAINQDVSGDGNGDGGANSDAYHLTCQGLDIDSTKTSVADTDALENDIIWRFLLIQDTANQIDSLDIEGLDKLSGLAIFNDNNGTNDVGNDWIPLGTLASGHTNNTGYMTSDGTVDGCPDSTGTPVNHVACARKRDGADPGGFSMALESDGLDSQGALSPSFYLIVQAIKMDEAGDSNHTYSDVAAQTLAYYVLSIGVQITNVN